MIQKIVEAIRKPKRVALFLLRKFSGCFSDELYLKILFRLKMGYPLNLQSPRTFNEKLQWLKLYNRKPEYTQMVDKYAVKEYVAKLIGEEYIIPTLGVWDRVEDIDFESLPNQFVLKTTHGGGGGGVVICKDKATFNRDEARKRLQQSLDSDIYHNFREWPYKSVPRRIIAEKHLNPDGEFLCDYKWYCFDGEPKCLVIASGRFVEPQTCFDYFDMDFNHLPIEQGGPNYRGYIARPTSFDEMKQIVALLSQGLPHARIDLFEVKNQIYFGEITFFDSSGLAKFYPNEWDYIFGSWIKLPK